MKKLHLILIASACIIGYFIWSSTQIKLDGLLHIYILDIGQGDATLIITPEGKRMLIDSGPSPQALEKALNTVLPDSSKHIDILSLSHPDKDHAFGVIGLEETLKPKLTILSQVLAKTQYKKIVAELRNTSSLVFADAGKDFQISQEVRIDTLYPFAPSPGSIYEPTNDGSIIQKLSFRNFSMLFTGDIGIEPLEVLTEFYGENLRSTILKMPHHGSKNNWTESFLKSVNAPITTISSGKNNSYYHPSPETIQELKKLDTHIYDTQEIGTFELKTDGYSVEVCYLKFKKEICQDKLPLSNSQK